MNKLQEVIQNTIQKIRSDKQSSINQEIQLFNSQINNLFYNTIMSDFREFMAYESTSKYYQNGQTAHLVNTANLLLNIIKKQEFNNVRRLEIIQNENNQSPFIYLSLDRFNCQNDKKIVFYGHFDKEEVKRKEINMQSNIVTGPGCTDCSQLFQMIMLIKLIQINKKSHCNIDLIVSSDQLINNVDLLRMISNPQNKIKVDDIDLLIDLDTSCKDYRRIWRTSCRKGQIVFDVNIQSLDEDVYFPETNGLVATNDRIAMDLITKIRDNAVGWVDDSLQSTLNSARLAEIERMAYILNNDYSGGYFRMCQNTELVDQGNFIKQMINNYQRPQLSIYGINGIDPVNNVNPRLFSQKQSGSLIIRMCLQLAPDQDPQQSFQSIRQLITQNTPYQSRVTVNLVNSVKGISVPIDKHKNTNRLLNYISEHIFGSQMEIQQESSHSAFIAYVNQMNPNTDILCTGYNGPFSFSHSENQNLNLQYFLLSSVAMSSLVSQYSVHN